MSANSITAHHTVHTIQSTRQSARKYVLYIYLLYINSGSEFRFIVFNRFTFWMKDRDKLKQICCSMVCFLFLSCYLLYWTLRHVYNVPYFSNELREKKNGNYQCFVIHSVNSNDVPSHCSVSFFCHYMNRT